MGPLHSHCRLPRCPCNHETCDRGWVDRLDDRGNTVGTLPCPGCRPELAGAVLLATNRDTLRRNLAAHRRGQDTPADASELVGV